MDKLERLEELVRTPMYYPDDVQDVLNALPALLEVVRCLEGMPAPNSQEWFAWEDARLEALSRLKEGE